MTVGREVKSSGNGILVKVRLWDGRTASFPVDPYPEPWKAARKWVKEMGATTFETIPPERKMLSKDLEYLSDTIIKDTTKEGMAHLHIYKCQCGYNFGVDAVHMERAGPVDFTCPNCRTDHHIKW